MDNVDLLLFYLEKYYSKNFKQLDDIKNIINQEYIIDEKNPNQKISLRILDFFITTFAKSHETYIENFAVYKNYKLVLKSFHKKFFDPFCRKHKLMFYYGKNSVDYIETSCGQLCFFKWCFENGIVEHVIKNYDTIDYAMKHALPKRKRFKVPIENQEKEQPTNEEQLKPKKKNKKGIVLEFNS